ncbi:[FeFe]-hydrogenase [Pelomyxa schiedti]|nr:[FeFe]-hydrogenase [Pelomyxa schiedti]
MFLSRRHGLLVSSEALPPPEYLPPQKAIVPPFVNIRVNSRPIRAQYGWTILRACRENGIHIPTLCHHPSVPPFGKCGVCVVQVERGPPTSPSFSAPSPSPPGTPPIFGKKPNQMLAQLHHLKPQFVMACKTQVEEGMSITTNSAAVLYQSSTNLAEFLGTRRLEGMLPAPEIEDLIAFTRKSSAVNDEQQEYAVIRDQSLCCLCTRCVRICSEIQNMNVLRIVFNTPLSPIVFENDLPLHATSCITCGQCTLVCPTGAVAERNDCAIVEKELDLAISATKVGKEKKILVLQTAPSSRVSIGEMLGEEPGQDCTAKLVEAAHTIGFDLVFDTQFAADTCATHEAMELVERVNSGGPFPLFTSCCPGWVKLVENKYPHLRPLLSKGRSPMMMLGSMIRMFMKEQNIPRQKYFVVALMPCIAKKEEITRPELKDPDGNSDVDVVLTVREMGTLLKKRLGTPAWASLHGAGNCAFDEPFNLSSGGGSLFATSGGVTEAALRVAYTYLSKEKLTPSLSATFEECRNIGNTESWLETKVDATPGHRLRSMLDIAIVSSSKKIQEFLSTEGLEDPDSTAKGVHQKHFVECMCCPSGCIGGGGQPKSLDEHIIEKRRAAIYALDKRATELSPFHIQQKFQQKHLSGVMSDKAHAILEYEHPMFLSPRSTKNLDDSTSSTSETSASICILYGSQGGVTASYARQLHSFFESNLNEQILIYSMDRFPLKLLSNCLTLIFLTSTWATENKLMPCNAQKFYEFLCGVPLNQHHKKLAGTRFAVLGFGSTKYQHFCGFAIELYTMLRRLGASPFMDLVKIDVERTDRGVKPFNRWMKAITSSLVSTDLPSPRILMIPSVAPARHKASTAVCPSGYHMVTVTKVAEYKALSSATEHYFYVEFATEKNFIDPSPGDYLHILPSNPRAEVEQFLNTFFPGMVNVSVTVLSLSGKPLENIPSHLTVLQLFEQFVDLYGRPSKDFLERLLAASGEEKHPLVEITLDQEGFVQWAKDQTYFSILRQFKSIVSLEVLLSMIPPIIPRCYTPIHLDPPRPHTIAICVKHIDDGLCSRFLVNSKRGDKIPVFISGCELPQPNFFQNSKFNARLSSDQPVKPALSINLVGSSLLSVSAGKSAGSVTPRDASVTPRDSSVTRDSGGTPRESTSTSTTPPPREEFPLSLSVLKLTFSGSGRLPVGVAVKESFQITNSTKDKARYSIDDINTHKYTLSFYPANGVIKPHFSVDVQATLTALCTTIISSEARISAELTGKTSQFSLPISAETKLSVRLDFDEINRQTQVGKGGYGSVFKAEWRGQEVAVKVLHNQDPLPVEKRDFERECGVLEELRSPYIVSFVGFCLNPLCIVTEFLPLGSLSKYVFGESATPLSEEYKFKAMLNSATGMTFLHKSGIMHRDLKPDNILVVSLDANQNVVCKLTDFGTTRECTDDTKRMTRGIGTPTFMSPEVYQGGQYSMSTDVFSFAVLLYEVFSGIQSYSGAEFTQDWMIPQFVISGKRLTIPPSVPERIANLIKVCWSQEPQKRPTFSGVQVELDAISNGRPTTLSAAANSTPAPVTTPPPHQSGSHRSKHHHHHHRPHSVSSSPDRLLKANDLP